MITNKEKIRVWLVDDHQLFRTGFRTLLNRLKGVEVTREAGDGAEFLSLLASEQPDLVFIDISMPQIDGIKATQAALERFPDLNIVILSMYGEKEYYVRLAEMGIKGFLLKSCDFNEVELAIDAIRTGDFYFSQELLQQMFISRSDSHSQSQTDELSSREKEILVEICRGASNQEIADHLFISKRTVEKHRANLLLKTSSSNTASLVIYAVKNGLFVV